MRLQDVSTQVTYVTLVWRSTLFIIQKKQIYKYPWRTQLGGLSFRTRNDDNRCDAVAELSILWQQPTRKGDQLAWPAVGFSVFSMPNAVTKLLQSIAATKFHVTHAAGKPRPNEWVYRGVVHVRQRANFGAERRLDSHRSSKLLLASRSQPELLVSPIRLVEKHFVSGKLVA